MADAGTSLNHGPLQGITVLDLTHIGAGPYLTSMLGDMGAEVIKIEPVGGGDPTRAYDAVFPGADSSYFMGLNRSKKSIVLNLKSEGGMRVLDDILARSQVVVESYRPGALRRLGLDYDSVARKRPDIVYCSISAFGVSGPYANRPGMDILVQGMGGLMGITGEPGRQPVKAGPPLADFIGSYLAGFGISMALLARERWGIGQLVTVSLLDGLVASMANYLTGFHVNGKPSGPSGGGHAQIVPYQIFTAKDGYLIIACLTEGFWRNLCKALDLNELVDDPRFVTNEVRVAHRQELVPIISDIIETRTRAEWTEILVKADVPCGPVNSLAEVFADPQVNHNKMVLAVEHPEAGEIKVPGIPIKLSRTPGAIGSPPPLLGQHTETILRGMGYSIEAIDELRQAGALCG
ncbi:MAG: CaiB/BaiF CoA transferase family protein [Reyranellaceae bacterium]